MTNLLNKIDLDDILAKFSMWGRYHAVAIVWLTLAVLFEAMSYSNFVLIIEKVSYRCVDNTANNEIRDVKTLSLENNTAETWCQNPESCSQWIYENPDSFVAEWKRNLVGTVHSIGYMIGIIILGPLSDRFGRRTLVAITGLTGAICGIAKSFAYSYWIYILFEFLEAAIGDPYLTLYLLALEMVSTENRVNYTTLADCSFVIAGILVPFIKWMVPYWRTCIRVMYGLGLLFAFFTCALDESPRWLLTKGKINAVVKNIEKAAKLNGIEINENLAMLTYEEDISSDFMSVMADTFKSRLLLKRLFICIIWWNTCTFVDHGLTVNSVFLDGNKFVNFALVASVRLPVGFFAAYILNRFSRKVPLIASFVGCTVLCACQPFVSKNQAWLSIIMFMASKATSGTFFKCTYVYTAELFPTDARNTMQALCSSLGRIGGVVATQMPLLLAYWSGLPILMFGASALVAALVTLLVPDTAKAPLPDTVRQAEALETQAKINKRRVKRDSTSIN